MMRSEEFEEALEACWLCLQRGESVQVCLSSYPEFAGALAPLLAVTQDLRGLAAERPDATVHLARAREQLLRRAAQARARNRRMPSQDYWGRICRQFALLLAPLLRRGAASTVVTVALILILLAGTTMIASANSLPGDALYPVKRVAESVQLALTFDQDSRASIMESFAQRRIEETRAVLELHKVTDVSFGGIVEFFDGSTLIAAGITVRFTPTTRVIGLDPAVGRFVTIAARSRADGTLVAQRVETIYATSTPRSTRTRQAADRPATVVAIVNPTTTATRWPSSADSNPARPTSQPVSASTPVALATVTLTPTLTVTPTATVAPTAVATATSLPPREVEVRFEGPITRLGPRLWHIGGHTVHVTPDTRLDERQAQAVVGAWAHVIGIRHSDGSIIALEIVVERGPTAPGERVEFQGTIEALSDTQWTVGGQVIEITSATVITGEPQLGWLAEVEARRQPNGVLQALEILVRAPEEIPVEFVGVIEAMASDHWLVAGQIVRLDGQTVIHGKGQVGWQAEVQGVELADGAIRALAIWVKGPQPSKATATASPGAWPTMTPTPSIPAVSTLTETPEVGANLQATVSPTPTLSPTAASTGVPIDSVQNTSVKAALRLRLDRCLFSECRPLPR